MREEKKSVPQNVVSSNVKVDRELAIYLVVS